MKSILIVAMLFTAMYSIALATTADNTKYRPYKHDYPQIIQAHDYETIQFIEALYSNLSKLGKEEAYCELHGDTLILKSKSDPTKTVFIKKSSPTTLTINDRHFTNTTTLTLFMTLKKVLTDLSTDSKCSSVAFSQHQTRAYKKRTTIEFNCKAKVAVIDAFSNGPKNDERLYILDLVDTNASYFWGK